MAYVWVSLLALLGTCAAWALIVIGARGAYRAAEPPTKRLMRWYARVVFPLICLALAVAVSVALTLKHYLHPSERAFFVIWMITGVCCLVPALIYVGVHTYRHRDDSAA